MAASLNLSQFSRSSKSPSNKTGVLTIHGYGVRVRMQSGHLEIEDGIGPERRKFRLARVGHGLKRLVCISEDGFVTLAALKWLGDQKVPFVMLERDGKFSLITGPTASSDARLRRAQALARDSGAALEIMRELMSAKLKGQQQLVGSRLNNSEAADVIAKLHERLPYVENLDAVAHLETQAAYCYWSAWSGLPIMYPRQDMRRVPGHWSVFGTRKSILTGSPRLATNPPNAILNYCYALLESEARLAAVALGLDPGLGFLHVDTPARDSLACDIMEAVRPAVDAWLLDWLTREPFRRSDFFEESNGNCRILKTLAMKLSETAPIWGKLVAPWAEFVAQTLSSGIRSKPVIATRLTQRNKRNVQNTVMPPVHVPHPEHACGSCGENIPKDKKLCLKCWERETMKEFRAGRKLAQGPESLAKRANTMLRHRQKIKEWKPSNLPAWLTRDVYVKQILPALASVPKSRIRLALRVSEPYSADIQAGKRIPHPRHWQLLSQLAGVSAASFGLT